MENPVYILFKTAKYDSNNPEGKDGLRCACANKVQQSKIKQLIKNVRKNKKNGCSA